MANFAISTDTNYSSLTGIANGDSLTGTDRATLTINTSTVDLNSYFFQNANILIKNTSTTTPIFIRWNNAMTHRFASNLDIEGELILVGTSNGTANQSFTLPTGLEPDGVTAAKYKDTIALYLDEGATLDNGDSYNTVWRQVDSLTDALGSNSRTLGNQYTHNFTANTVTFGDGTNGTIPPNGTNIYIPNIVIEKGATSSATTFDWKCETSINFQVSNAIIEGSIRLFWSSYDNNVFQHLSHRSPNLWLISSNLTQQFKSCCLTFPNTSNFGASNNQKYTSCNIHHESTQSKLFINITGENSEFQNCTLSQINTGAISSNDVAMALSGKNTIIKNNDFAGRFFNLFRASNSRNEFIKNSYWETSPKRVVTWTSQPTNFNNGWHVYVITQQDLTIQNTTVRTPSTVGGISGEAFINYITGTSDNLTIDGLDWGVQNPSASYYRVTTWNNAQGSTRLNNFTFDGSGVITQFLIAAFNTDATNIEFNNSAGYSLGMTGATTNVTLNNAMTLGDNGYIYNNTTFNWASTLQTTPNSPTDAKIVFYYNNFDSTDRPNYFSKLVETGDIYLTGSNQVQIDTIGDKCQFIGDVHYGINSFTAVYDGVYQSNSSVKFSIRRKYGTYTTLADLTLSNLQSALAGLPADVLKSVQIKLVVEKLTSNQVPINAPNINTTLDNTIDVPVFGLWGDTYFPQSGETITTAYDRVIFQESGSYTTTVTLPFVDVLNNSTVTLNADTTPTVVQQTSGTITVVLPQAQASVSNIVSGSRILVRNETQSTVVENSIVTGTSYNLSYQNGTTFSTGDVIRVNIEYNSGTTAKKTFAASAVANDNGWSILAEQEDDEIYISYGHDGSTLTNVFQADYVNDEIDIIFSADWYASQMYSWFVYNKSTQLGILEPNLLLAINQANLSLTGKVDNTTSNALVQLDNIRVSRPDGTYPVKHPTTGGGGIDIVWQNTILVVETGISGLTPDESAKLTQTKGNTDVILGMV